MMMMELLGSHGSMLILVGSREHIKPKSKKELEKLYFLHPSLAVKSLRYSKLAYKKFVFIQQLCLG